MRTSRGPRRISLVAAGTALALTVVGCGSDPGAGPTDQVMTRLYGTDGNMQDWLGQEFKDRAGILKGMKGTTPLTPLSEDFKDRLRDIDPDLNGFLYAAETYDALVISAIAAQLAGTTKPTEIAKQINGVTNGGQRCDNVRQCLRLARAGVDVEYRGVSLTRGGFTEAGEPSTASYATLHFGGDDRIDNGKTEFLGAGDESSASAATPPPPKAQDSLNLAQTGAPLRFGGLLPQTGSLSDAYPPLAAPAALAIREINAAGGVFGMPVEWFHGNDGTNPETARKTVAAHVERGVHVIIGAGASGISRAVLPDVVAAGLILFSPCNTDAGLSTVADEGLYFRTAPSDILQGRALADMILRDGPRRIALVARGDSYGEGLQENVRAELERAGHGADQVMLLTYEPPDDENVSSIDFSAHAQEIKRYGAEAVLIIGYAESAPMIRALADAGITLRH
jgi:ABC-type branched-subunit amino acid transport system substrate-binding protein